MYLQVVCGRAEIILFNTEEIQYLVTLGDFLLQTNECLEQEHIWYQIVSKIR